jgi:hypothetical protein
VYDEAVVESGVGHVADEGDQANEESPSEAKPTEGEPLVEVVSSGFEFAQDTSIAI